MNEKENKSPADQEEIANERELFKREFLKMRSKYENKIAELSVLKELGHSLRSAGVSTKKGILTDQLNIIKKYSSLECVSLWLLTENQQMLSLVASTEENESVHEQPPVLVENGMLGQVVMAQRPLVISRSRMNHDEGGVDNGSSCTMLCIPVMDKIEPMGVLTLVRPQQDSYDQNEISFFSLVADQIAGTVVLYRIHKRMLKEESKRFLLSRFFSKNVSEEILGKKGNIRLGGERKHATIVFADLKGFTSISESLDQEKVVEILNAFFSRMTPIIFKHEGTLDKLLGDGLMAVFGAPISNSNSAVQALRAAIEMMKALLVFNFECRNRQWPELHMAIGLNAGDVVAGYIGSEDHLNYTVIGDAVNVAQRLQSIAAADEILASSSVADEVEEKESEVQGLKGLNHLPAQMVKGKREAIEVFRIEY